MLPEIMSAGCSSIYLIYSGTIEQLQDWETNGFTEENEGEEVYNLVLEGEHTFYDDAYFYLCSPEALVNGIELEEDPSIFPFFWED